LFGFRKGFYALFLSLRCVTIAYGQSAWKSSFVFFSLSCIRILPPSLCCTFRRQRLHSRAVAVAVAGCVRTVQTDARWTVVQDALSNKYVQFARNLLICVFERTKFLLKILLFIERTKGCEKCVSYNAKIRCKVNSDLRTYFLHLSISYVSQDVWRTPQRRIALSAIVCFASFQLLQYRCWCWQWSPTERVFWCRNLEVKWRWFFFSNKEFHCAAKWSLTI